MATSNCKCRHRRRIRRSEHRAHVGAGLGDAAEAVADDRLPRDSADDGSSGAPSTSRCQIV